MPGVIQAFKRQPARQGTIADDGDHLVLLTAQIPRQRDSERR